MDNVEFNVELDIIEMVNIVIIVIPFLKKHSAADVIKMDIATYVFLDMS